MIHSKRMLALLLSVATSATIAAAPASAASTHLHRGSIKTLPPLKVLDRFDTKDGRAVTVVAGDMALVKSPNGTRSVRYLPDVAMSTHGIFPPDRSVELAALNKPPTPARPYENGTVVVILRSGTGLPDTLSLSHADLAAKHTYSGDAALNTVLTHLGVNYVKRLFTSIGENRLAAMRARASDASTLLPLENTYVLRTTHATVPAAVAQLRAVSAVLAAEPNFYVSPMHTFPIPLKRAQISHAMAVAVSGHDRAATGRALSLSASQSNIPSNYAVAYSAQSALNAPGTNAVAAYDEIERHFHQLPGAGEIITNVSVGNILDASIATDKSSPCYGYVQWEGGGATVGLIGGQHYLEMPSLPLIPAYVADDAGDVSGTGMSCGQDSLLEEVGLDFSVMAALPHQLQQSGLTGSGYSDLLGIAPGASYRLVVPETTQSFIPTVFQGPTNADLAGALMGAALQNPAPNVINMSLGFGFDSYGFPSRFLEEDPVLQAAVQYVIGKGIVVTIASGDGLRTYTNAAVGPSGGTVPIDTVASGGTNISDDEFSTIPSQVTDSGAIAVGGTTLDDIMSAPPDQPEYAKYRDQLTFPQVRWNGFGSFASSYGTRVNISAPSDNVLADFLGGTTFEGGTSAAAPMVAAGAAVALQVARLTGKPLSPQAVRQFLVSTARPVPNVPQADVPVQVGPQLDVENEVETLLRDAHMPLHPVLNRVAIAQRYPQSSEFVFSTDTDPTEIDLNDTYALSPGQAGSSAFGPITIAPDWEEMPAGTKFRVYLAGNPHKSFGTGPWVRVFPQQLLAATNQPFYSTQPRSVNLTYQAYNGYHVLANTSVALTFAPNGKVLQGVGPAPTVPSVVTGPTIPVQYDISNVDPKVLSNPTLIVSYPGRMSTWGSGDPGYKAAYSVPLTQLKGTIQVPVSALQGDGIYGIAVQINTWFALTNGGATIGLNKDAPVATTWAYTRVATSNARPAAPILRYQGDANFPAESGHAIDVSYNHPFQASWNVSDIKGATGAILEISAAGPSLFGNYNMFNNPNGSALDNNGADAGEMYKLALSGTRGSTLVNAWPSITAAEFYTVRVFATVGSQMIGEGGNVSTIETHGILPSDGGSVLGGFVTNQGATIGMLTSNQLDSTNREDTSIEEFDPQSLGINYSLAWNSTDAGTYGGGTNVPMYMLNGFDMDPNGSTYVALENAPWFSYPGAANISALEYIPHPQQLPSNTFESCYACFNVAPYAAEASYEGDDYLLSLAGVTPFTYAQGVVPTAGTPIPMPAPTGFVPCGGFTTGDGVAVGAYVSDDNNSVALQRVNLLNGQTSPTNPLTGSSTLTCNVSFVNGNLGMLATQGEQGALYQATSSAPNTGSVLLWGYYPLTITPLLGNQIDGWAIQSALSPDYLTDDNATSTITIVDQYFGYTWYGRFGNVYDVPIAVNNRLAASGSGGVVYLLGFNGDEIAPFYTGL